MRQIAADTDPDVERVPLRSRRELRFLLRGEPLTVRRNRNSSSLRINP